MLRLGFAVVAAAISGLLGVPEPTCAEDREAGLAWLEAAIAKEEAVQGEFLRVAFDGDSGDLPVARSDGDPYYEMIPVNADFPESDRERWVSALNRVLVAGSFGRVVVERAGEVFAFPVPLPASVSLVDVPVSAIAAATVCAGSDLRGSESDLIVGSERSPLHVTILHEPDRLILRVASAPRTASAGPYPSGAELQRRFGVGEFVDGDRAWSGPERQIVADALERLPAQDLSIIAGLPFLRTANPPEDRRDAAAWYKWGGLDRAVEFFDAAFADDRAAFVGDPDDPIVASAWPILHELGHAVSFEKPYKAVNGFVARMTAIQLFAIHVREFAVSNLRTERKRLDAIRERLDDLARPLGRFQQAAKGGTLHASPVLSAYREATGGHPVTLYGATDLGEAFAEAYAMYLLDPDALERIQPAALAFFRSGAYQLAPLEVEPPPVIPDHVRKLFQVPEDDAFDAELDQLLEDEVGPLD